MKVQNINKVLIANRGEITVRIIHTLNKLGISSVAVYSKHDSEAFHVKFASEAYPLGSGDLEDTYLNVEKIVSIAKKVNADAIHPGYGFLAENPLLVEACEKNNIIFIGPDARSMRLMGNKIAARDFAIENGLPVTKGLTGNTREILDNSSYLPFPVLVKAAAGGGGKGMRIVHHPNELEAVLETTAREAKNYFGDGTVYLEQYIEQPRHIEVQVLGDIHGNVIHLFERECTIQRRYQKIIEESPSPTLSPEIRQQMGEAAVKLCKAIGYRNAGTIEFLVDQNLHFYFLEMNTRIQVEHPVTELVTDIDLVEEQILIAQGQPLRIEQADVIQTGHAIECRIYAEDPANNFMPSPGKINLYVEPLMDDVRIDSSMVEESEIFSFYDPMISKLIVWGESREQAIHQAKSALTQYAIHGIQTNISYLLKLISHPRFLNNEISTNFCDDHTSELILQMKRSKEMVDPVFPATAFLFFNMVKNPVDHRFTVWQEIGYWRHTMIFDLKVDDRTFKIEIHDKSPKYLHAHINEQEVKANLISFDHEKILVELNEQVFEAFVSSNENGSAIIEFSGNQFHLRRMDELELNHETNLFEHASDMAGLFAPMPGKVIKLNVENGEHVKRGTVLLVVEAMKMENNIVAPVDAIVDKINVQPGDMVDTKTQMVHLKEIE